MMLMAGNAVHAEYEQRNGQEESENHTNDIEFVKFVQPYDDLSIDSFLLLHLRISDPVGIRME